MKGKIKFAPEYYHRSRQTLEFALSSLDAYKPWRELDPGPNFPVDARYAALPVLTKADIRRHFPRGFVPPDRDIDRGLESGEISFVQTSGSSDSVRVTNIWYQKWWDAAEEASWGLNAHTAVLSHGDVPEAILANARNVGFISDDVDLPLEKRRLSRFLYLNEKTDPSRWSAALMERMLDELGTFRPVILEANPSLLARLCRYAVASGRKDVYQPAVIIFTYEYPSVLHLRQIRRIFRVPMASSYGSTETGYVFMQCEAGRFHQNSRFCRVDMQPLKEEHGGPALARLLVTTFDNPWYYILRFDVGDLVRVESTMHCPCGRRDGVILSAVEGRFTNATLDCRGRLVTLRELDEAMGTIEEIDEYRLEQTSADRYVIHLVSEQKNSRALSRKVQDRLRGVYGRDADITIAYADGLAPEDSGKYSLARTLFPLRIEDYLAAGGGTVEDRASSA
ncbi:MAG: hypothetical protein N2506_01960 [Dehalococcoidales bacterium]|nr:hypothetical protein [Dehalococcoidales bacterium]